MSDKTAADMTRTQDDISATKRRIMTLAAELFAEKGYGSVGISEVGEAAGFGKGALYYHIGSKEDLLFEIMTDYMVDLIGAAELIMKTVPESRGRIVELSRSFMSIMFKSRSEMTVCFREVHALGDEKRKGVLAMHAEYQDICIRALKAGEAAGDFRPIPKVEIKALLGMYFYSFLWVKADGPVSLRAIADSFASIVLKVARRET
jgi:TetR/AcrR family transcriptional regulator, cholesterol catabolism regulator